MKTWSVLRSLSALMLSALPSLAQGAAYVPYEGHDVRVVLELKQTETGQHTATIDGGKLRAIVDDLGLHARNYPPTFRAPKERELATRDAKQLSELLTMLGLEKQEKPSIEVLLLMAQLESIAHNLDVKDASTRAITYFEALLKHAPDHVAGNLHFGTFLAGTATRQKDALPYLEKALKLGEEQARYPLGMLCLMQGDKPHGLEHLKAYLAKNPGDEKARLLIKAIEGGAEVTRRVNGKEVPSGQEKVPPGEPAPAPKKQ